MTSPDEGTSARLRALPFWNGAITTENGAIRDLNARAAAETDPLVRQAVEMQTIEEARYIALFINWMEPRQPPVVAWPCVPPALLEGAHAASMETIQDSTRRRVEKQFHAQGRRLVRCRHRSQDVLSPVPVRRRTADGMFDLRLKGPRAMPAMIGLLARIIPAAKSKTG